MLRKDTLTLITGAHGFIGGHLARRLHAEGYKIRTTDIKPCPPFNAPTAGEVVIGNLCDPQFCRRVVQDVDVVIHLAATMGGMGTIHAQNDFVIYRENQSMTLNLLHSSLSSGVRGFFYASSACVYPESLQAPGTDVSLTEDDAWKNPPPKPQGLYGLEKLVTELVLSQYASDGLQLRIARFHNIYGPMGSWFGGREKVPAAFLRKAIAAQLSGEFPPKFEIWGDGKQRRSFCFIDDALEAILRLLESDCSVPVNIGSEHAVSIQQLADMASTIAGLDPQAVAFGYKSDRPVGVGSRNSNNAFVRARLGWEPARSLEDGMSITGQWISEQIKARVSSFTSDADRADYLRLLQTSDMVDLTSEAITFAILLPITSRSPKAPNDCLDNLAHFARALLETTANDTSRLGERYRVRVYLAIDADDTFLWRSNGANAAELILAEHGFAADVVTLPPCTHPPGHVCALWRDCARRAYEDRCDYYVLMGDDVVLQDSDWMSVVHGTFTELSAELGVPHGIGCVAFTDTTFPGMPTFPVVHRSHMDIFDGEVIPDCFINQDGDPFLFQLYRRWGASKMVAPRITNRLGGSGLARYDKVHAADWTFGPLDNATEVVETWLMRDGSTAERNLTLDIIIPCYRVNPRYIDAFLSLRSSETCSVMFIIIIDDPLSPHIADVVQKYGHRVDVRIRVNSQNLGAPASRNRGLQESAAEWVHFLDDDVSPEPDLLVEAEKAIRAHPDAAGFVCNAQFPSADSVFTAAVHLAGVTFFWNIAEKIQAEVPWGVTANLIARRNVVDQVTFDLQFPKTGGGEDIDFCRQKRKYSVARGREGFWAAPEVKVTHPWWNGGRRSYWRFYMWSKGDGGLINLYPEHSYRDLAPNAAECLLVGFAAIITGCFTAAVDVALALAIFRVGVMMVVAILASNIVHDLLQHLVLHPERTVGMKTNVQGARWFCAVVEGALIRVFSEWGRVIGILERGEFSMLMKRFDWFCGVWGKGPRQEEMRNNQMRLVLTVSIFAFLMSSSN